jgi:Protein of unknown function (DUF3455)
LAVQQRWVRRFVGAAAMTFLSACAGSGAFITDDIPDSLRAPAAQLLTQQLHAKGVQIYQCRPSQQEATRFEWSLLAPEAVLMDKTGKKVAKHYAGPTWEAYDGSQVVGQVVARANSPAGDSIPWLLLRAQSNSGRGHFGSVVTIQRLHTVGGNAPPACGPSQADQQIRVPYSADYFFYEGPRS